MTRNYPDSDRSSHLRARTLSLLAGLAASFMALPSAAALLPVSGTFTLQFSSLTLVDLTGTGSASSVGAPGSSHTLPAGFFSVGPSPASAFILPTFSGIDSFTVPIGVQNAGGSFGPNGAMPLLGTGAFFAKGGTPAGAVPLSPVGGTGTAPFMAGGLNGTLLGATFQGAGNSGPVVFNYAAGPLGVPVTVTATAYDNRTAGGVGTVQLVAPATGSLGIFGALPTFGVLRIEYTPEPSTLLLLGGGIAALAAGMRRKKARQDSGPAPSGSE